MEGPPEKKRKTTHSEGRPNVIKLALSIDESHLIAVTGEDKCIRVFHIDDSGALGELSQRQLLRVPPVEDRSNRQQMHAEAAVCHRCYIYLV